MSSLLCINQIDINFIQKFAFFVPKRFDNPFKDCGFLSKGVDIGLWKNEYEKNKIEECNPSVQTSTTTTSTSPSTTTTTTSTNLTTTTSSTSSTTTHDNNNNDHFNYYFFYYSNYFNNYNFYYNYNNNYDVNCLLRPIFSPKIRLFMI
jgi:hypothetical protein